MLPSRLDAVLCAIFIVLFIVKQKVGGKLLWTLVDLLRKNIKTGFEQFVLFPVIMLIVLTWYLVRNGALKILISI